MSFNNTPLTPFKLRPHLVNLQSDLKKQLIKFLTPAGTVDEKLIDRCEEFLTSKSDLKLLVINTVHKAMDTREFLSVLAEQYEQFNVVVLTIAPPQPVCLLSLFLVLNRI